MVKTKNGSIQEELIWLDESPLLFLNWPFILIKKRRKKAPSLTNKSTCGRFFLLVLSKKVY
jgi:hypothetical protein